MSDSLGGLKVQTDPIINLQQGRFNTCKVGNVIVLTKNKEGQYGFCSKEHTSGKVNFSSSSIKRYSANFFHLH